MFSIVLALARGANRSKDKSHKLALKGWHPGAEAGNSAAGTIIELLFRCPDTVRGEGRLNSAFAATLSSKPVLLQTRRHDRPRSSRDHYFNPTDVL